jgi:hypothetical protein
MDQCPCQLLSPQTQLLESPGPQSAFSSVLLQALLTHPAHPRPDLAGRPWGWSLQTASWLLPMSTQSSDSGFPLSHTHIVTRPNLTFLGSIPKQRAWTEWMKNVGTILRIHCVKSLVETKIWDRGWHFGGKRRWKCWSTQKILISVRIYSSRLHVSFFL